MFPSGTVRFVRCRVTPPKNHPENLAFGASTRSPGNRRVIVTRSRVHSATGAPRASSIDFDGSIETWHIPSWWREGGTLKALTAGNEARTTVTARDMEDQGKVTAYYTGHGGFFNTITSSDADPNTFLTATTDSLVRLFDVRQPLPQLTFDCGESSISKIVAHYMHVDSLPGKHYDFLTQTLRLLTTVYSHCHRWGEPGNQGLGSSRSQARLRARHGQQLCGQLCMGRVPVDAVCGHPLRGL